MVEQRNYLLANYAMWIGDYESAIVYYEKAIVSNELDILSRYKSYFDLTIANAFLKNREAANKYLEELERVHFNIEKNSDIANQNMSKIQFSMKESFDVKKVENMLKEYFPSNETLLSLLLSPRYAKRILRNVLRNAERSKASNVLQLGIFKCTLHSEMYGVIGRAYSSKELELERLHNSDKMKLYIENANVFYGEDEKSNVIAAIQREGLVFCQYLLRSPQDIEGEKQIQSFLTDLSEVFQS